MGLSVTTQRSMPLMCRGLDLGLGDCEGREKKQACYPRLGSVCSWPSVDLLLPKHALVYRCPGIRDTAHTAGVFPMTEVDSQTLSTC